MVFDELVFFWMLRSCSGISEADTAFNGCSGLLYGFGKVFCHLQEVFSSTAPPEL